MPSLESHSLLFGLLLLLFFSGDAKRFNVGLQDANTTKQNKISTTPSQYCKSPARSKYHKSKVDPDEYFPLMMKDLTRKLATRPEESIWLQVPGVLTTRTQFWEEWRGSSQGPLTAYFHMSRASFDSSDYRVGRQEYDWFEELGLKSSLGGTIYAYHRSANEKLPSHFIDRCSGVKVISEPIDICIDCRDPIILYHYTSEDSARLIFKGDSKVMLWAAQIQEDNPTADCGFGEGTYAVQYEPAQFDSKEDIIQNNYANKVLVDQPGQCGLGMKGCKGTKKAPYDQACERTCKLYKRRGKADVAIPIRVSRSKTFNTRFEKTRGMKHGAGKTRKGEKLMEGRDVWVVEVRDTQQMIQAVHNTTYHFYNDARFDYSDIHNTGLQVKKRLQPYERLSAMLAQKRYKGNPLLQMLGDQMKHWTGSSWGDHYGREAFKKVIALMKNGGLPRSRFW
eukprot:gnl/MRDRNA2_/MRDRNA2_83359_c0_seq1.p1 gnl/MRDRNA2_/MRDRNA2_83359_c0~~gnl/MRDRNA2_/MRDRNA2_83359_c0_seq1.p1  ORF type:complete len:450 (+),score=44.21 gnl/MRDRNA2_/MRDRNA2_83359_c0_seq1:69-1418(+)